MNTCTKFGINPKKTDGSTGDQSERKIISALNIFKFLSLRGCEEEKKINFLALMAGTKYGFGSASIHASDHRIR